MKVQKTIDIAAPPHKVWPFFIEPEKVMQWCITFKKYEYMSNKFSGLDTPIYIEEQAGGPLMKLHFKINECKENEVLALLMISGTGVKAYTQRWLLEANPMGTRFTFREEVELPFGLLGKLLGSLMEGTSERTVDKMLGKLKSLAEA